MNAELAVLQLCSESPYADYRDNGREALSLLLAAHYWAATANMNASNQLAAALGESGVDLKSAFIGALSVVGGKHAPVTEIRDFLFRELTIGNMEQAITRRIERKNVPGWGNSFHKTSIDPALEKLAQFVEDQFPNEHALIAAVTDGLHRAGKMVLPNIGCYTAVIAQIIGLQRGAELLLFALPRLPVWTKCYLAARYAAK